MELQVWAGDWEAESQPVPVQAHRPLQLIETRNGKGGVRGWNTINKNI